MKKHLKTVLAIGLAMVLMLLSIPVSAANSSDSENIFQYYPNPDTTTFLTFQSAQRTQSLGVLLFRQKASKVTVSSSNSKIASVKAVKESNRITQVLVTPKKSGTVIITTKTKGKVQKNKIVIKNYTNPLNSVTLGDTTISGNKLNKKDSYNLKYSKYAGKDNIFRNLKSKKGWGLYEIYETVNNKTTVLRTVNTFKPRSGRGKYQLIFCFRHFKTGRTVAITFNFK